MVSILKRLTKCIFRPENLLVDYTAAKEGYAGLEEEISEFKKQLFTEHIGGATGGIEPVKKNEAFMAAGQVQYVCRAGNFMKKDFPIQGHLRCLR